MMRAIVHAQRIRTHAAYSVTIPHCHHVDRP